MIRIRKFRLKRRITTFLRFILCRKTRSYSRLGPVDPERPRPGTICKLLSHLKSKARTLCFRKNPSRVQDRVHEPLLDHDRHVAIPKGKTAVYVGSEHEGDFRRVLVPVIYFNHPLFGELLRETEQEFGFDHPGGIIIPCRITEFEKVRTRIASSWDGRKKVMTWK